MAETKPTIKVEVRSRQGLVFSGDLVAVSSFNLTGPFDVLAEHTNFVSMIKKKLVLHRSDGRSEEINVDNGVIIVENNSVKVFIGVGKM
jgi:F0F1-type ATP synthase epsilon subunit